MDVKALLQQTLDTLDDANVPDAIRPVAFAKVFDALSNQAPASPNAQRDRGARSDDSTGLDRIAERLGLPLEVVDNAFVVDANGVELVIPPGRFEARKAPATEQIALLVAASRQAIGLDEDGWTSVDHIREACENFKKHDPSNFATTLRDMDDVFTVRGSGRDRKVRMTAPAWQRARDLVLGLTGSG
jgi:hypothetical protein